MEGSWAKVYGSVTSIPEVVYLNSPCVKSGIVETYNLTSLKRSRFYTPPFETFHFTICSYNKNNSMKCEDILRPT